MAERQAGSVLETRPRPGETVDLMRARDISDIKVRNPEGESLGDLTDIVIDSETGCITYAVLAYGGILGFGEKHFAIPWEATLTRPGERVAIVDTDKRTLDSASGFARDRMPREGDWSLIRTPPAHRAVEPAPRGAAEVAPTPQTTGAPESTLRGGESYVPVPPPVQTVAPGWGEQAMKPRAGERPVRTEAPHRETIVEEVRREHPAEIETRPVLEAERPLTTPGPSPGHLSAADLQVYLKGMDYPAGRQDLITHARKNDAPTSVITTLDGFSDRTYRSAADVSEEFGSEVHRRSQGRMETVTEEPAVVRTRAPSRAHLSAADLQVSLKGMDYPAGRQDLITHARGRNASADVIAVLEQFSDRTYQSAADVSVEFGKETHRERPVETGTQTRETVVEEVHREPRTEARRTGPSLAHLSAADLQVYLKGMDYPAGKQDLITHARKNDAPEDVITVLELFGDRTYRSAADVSTEFGNVK